MRLNGNGLAILTAFVGVGAGYLVGVLTAPAAGPAMRKELSSRARFAGRRLLRHGREAADRVAWQLERGIVRGRRRLSGTFVG